MSIFNKIFKSYSEKEVKRIMPIVDKINSLEDEISKLTDEELKNKTNEFFYDVKTTTIPVEYIDFSYARPVLKIKQ